MENTRNITEDLIYIGASDRKIALFESVYPVPNGISYNSYLLKDNKTVLFDTVDKSVEESFFENLKYALGGKKLDYMIINHMEPDHSAMIKRTTELYPDIKIVCNQKTKQLICQFFNLENEFENKFQIVKEGDTLNTGKHELTFVMAPMVHWPEVMVTYDKTDKILFSADAFGSFGAINGNLFDDEVDFASLIPEYGRYYTNIVGKYGMQVNMLLNKAKNIEIKTICPLHGLVIRKNIEKIVEKYYNWANYKASKKSVLIAYTSVYGSTQNTAEILAAKLAQKGICDIKMYDVSMTHDSYIISDIFEYSHIVLASTTYNNGIFVNMENLINEIISHNIQNKIWAFIENGSWAPVCGDLMREKISQIKNTTILDKKVTIKSSPDKTAKEDIVKLAEAIINSLN